MLASRVDRIGFSPTLAVSDLARKLRAEGQNVIDFAAGQPDFPTPDEAKRAGIEAIEADRTGYTANAGIPELRAAIAASIERHRGLVYAPEQILVSPGGKASLYFAFQALLDPGDEVLVPVPYWTSYPEQIRLADGEPRFVDTSAEDGFKLDVDRVERAITDRTRAIILNYPSNPTGACYDADELRPLVERCAERGLWILADEIYARLLYDGRSFVSAASFGRSVFDRCIVIDGASKAYSMTGWRIGWTAGPPEVIRAMAKLQSQTTSNATSISQWASLAAVELDDEALRPRTVEFQRRRDAMLDALRAIEGVTCNRPEGAFYAFPDVSGAFHGQVDSGQAMARYLLEKVQVAVVPGEAFGRAQSVRLSYATSFERVREGMGRVAKALAALGR